MEKIEEKSKIEIDIFNTEVNTMQCSNLSSKIEDIYSNNISDTIYSTTN